MGTKRDATRSAEVAKLYAMHLTDREIAGRLGITRQGVGLLRAKLGLEARLIGRPPSMDPDEWDARRQTDNFVRAAARAGLSPAEQDPVAQRIDRGGQIPHRPVCPWIGSSIHREAMPL